MKLLRKAVIPAAGYGTRFLPISKAVPKELLPIGNKPAIHYVVEEAVRAGIDQIIFVCHPAKTAIIDYFNPDKALKAFLEQRGKREELAELARLESMADFRVVYQNEPLGLGHAVWCAHRETGDDSFLVLLPDVLIAGADQNPTSELVGRCSLEKGWGVLLKRLSLKEIPSYGIVRGERVSDRDHRIIGAVEKPKPQEAPSDLGILGRYLLPPEIMHLLENQQVGVLGEIQLTDAINALAKESPGIGIVCEEETFDIGIPQGLREAQEYFDRQTLLP